MTEAEEAAKRVKWNERVSSSIHRPPFQTGLNCLRRWDALAIAHVRIWSGSRGTTVKNTLRTRVRQKSRSHKTKKPISDLRKRIKKRLKKHHPTAAETYRLDELPRKSQAPI